MLVALSCRVEIRVLEKEHTHISKLLRESPQSAVEFFAIHTEDAGAERERQLDQGDTRLE